jgi:circadian clock protein KaiB
MKWKLTLYVAGKGSRSSRTESNLRRICEEYLNNRHELEVVDVTIHPEHAESENILITPTLIRRSPKPLRRVVGDLSDSQAVLYGLDLSREAEDGGTK